MDILVYDAAGYAFWLFLCLSDECFINKVRRRKRECKFQILLYHRGDILVHKIEPHGEQKPKALISPCGSVYLFSNLGISEGSCATRMPAASKASILSFVEPEPPEIMAPAWPICFPGGADCPAINATTGLFT